MAGPAMRLTPNHNRGSKEGGHMTLAMILALVAICCSVTGIICGILGLKRDK